MEEENEDKADLNSPAAVSALLNSDNKNAVCQTDNSRFLDELSVANQLMALAGASDIYKSDTPVNVDFHTSLPYGYKSLYEAENLDVRPEYEPQNEQQQIQLEHSYAISQVLPNEENKEKSERSCFDIPRLPVQLIINIEDANLSLLESSLNKNKLNEVKESPNKSKSDTDFQNANIAVEHCISMKNNNEQCSHDLHLISTTSKQSSNSPLSVSSAPDSSVEVCSYNDYKEINTLTHVFFNQTETDASDVESIISRQTRKKRKAESELAREEINQTNLSCVKRISCLEKSNSKEEASNVNGQKKIILDSDNPLTSSVKLHKMSKNSVLSDGTKPLDNSDIEIDVINIDHKKNPILLSESILTKHHVKPKRLDKRAGLVTGLPKTRKLTKKNKILPNSANEKQKKSCNTFKDSNSSSKSSSEDAKELVYCKNINQYAISTKSHKKKSLKKESTRFSMNEAEPPLFSQPDVMIKVNVDFNGKKEVKDEETKKYVCNEFINKAVKNYNDDSLTEVKDTDVFDSVKEIETDINNSVKELETDINNSVKETENDFIGANVKKVKETENDFVDTNMKKVKETENDFIGANVKKVKETENDFDGTNVRKVKETEKDSGDSKNEGKDVAEDSEDETEKKILDNCKKEKSIEGNNIGDSVKEAEVALKEIEKSQKFVTDYSVKIKKNKNDVIDYSLTELKTAEQDVTGHAKTKVKESKKEMEDLIRVVKETQMNKNTIVDPILDNTDKIIETKVNTLYESADTSCDVVTKHTEVDCSFDNKVSSLSENAMKPNVGNDLTSFISMTFGHEKASKKKQKHRQPIKSNTLDSLEENCHAKEINSYINISTVENCPDENSKQSDSPKFTAKGRQPQSIQLEYGDDYSNLKEENADNEIKPERKSSRLIKKKEFFEYVLEPPITPPPPTMKKKISTQKQKSTKTKNSQKRKSSTSELEESTSDDDDPNKLWCICRRPHNNRFMIQCDTCEEWFHGSCVGVTKQQGCQLEKQKMEWICPTCRNKDNRNLEDKCDESEIPKDVKKKLHMIGKKNAHKPEHRIADKENSMSQKSNFKTAKCSVTSVDFSEDVPVEDEADRKIKSLQQKIQEQIDALSNKSKVNALSSKTSSSPQKQQAISLSHSNTAEKDSLKKEIKSSNAPLDKKKLPTVLKKKEMKFVPKKRLNCVQCQKSTAAYSCYCSFDCIEQHVSECLKSMQESAESIKDINTQRLVVFDRFKGNVITGEKRPTVAEIIPWLKENPSFMIACSSNSIHESKKEFPLKRECDSNANSEKRDDLTKVNIRINVKKTLKNILMDRCKNSEDIILPEEEIRKIAKKIEEELYAQFKDTNLKYRTKYRSLMFNIKDPRNQGLFRKILRGEISPDQVVHMTATELASVELSKWREQEMQHHLDMIKRVQLEQQKSGGSHMKKTHKGEVEIEDDFTTIIEQDVLKSVFKNDLEDNLEVDKEEQDSAKDTTQLHRSHLFDLNCKICTGKVLPPPDESTPKKLRVAHSISVDLSSPIASQITEKSISHATEKSVPYISENSLLEIFEKKSPVLISDEESFDTELISTTSTCVSGFSEKEINSDNAFKTTVSVWKGFIFMQDIAKFVTSAYKVSGQTDNLHVDLPDTIQVCGRIIPDQVWDYLGKIKQSGNKELIIIQFQAANHEEAVTYNTFYSYLNSRKRYGVVSNYSKKIKDFYIVPLPPTSPVPTVLMPFDGPGLPSPRPHLLLGVIVRHRSKQAMQSNMPKQVSKDDIEMEGSYTPPFEARSYTPPLPPQLPDNDLPEIYSESRSLLSETRLTSLEDVQRSPLSNIAEEDKPYDPEQDVLTLNSEWLKEKLINQKEIENIPSSKNLEEHKKLLDALTKQVEETDREVSALKHLVSNTEASNTSENFPNLCSKSVDITSVAETGMSSFLDLPSNLQEILNSVRLKSTDKDMRSNTKGDIDMRINSLNVHTKNSKSVFGLQNRSVQKFDEALKISEDKTSLLGAPPSEDKQSICYPSDPRIKLRMSHQDSNFTPDEQSPFPNKASIMEHSTNVAQMQKLSDKVDSYPSQNVKIPISGTSLPINYHHFREPPPPGIEPPELQSEDLYSLKTIDLPENSVALPSSPQPKPTQFANSLIHDTHSISAGFPPPSISFQTHLPPVFPVLAPPPFPHSLAMQSSFSPSEEKTNTMKEQWSSQQSGYPHEGKEWSERTSSSWDNSYSSERSRDFRHGQSYKRGNHQWERSRRYNRGNWHKRSLRGHKFDNRRGKRVYPYRKNHN